MLQAPQTSKSPITARVQEMHIMIGHMWCKFLEQRLGLV